MISKELLSEVLGEEVNQREVDSEGKIFKRELNNKIWWENNRVIKSINIHELAHKCKEWAFDKGYRLRVQKIEDGDYQCVIDEMNIKFHSAKYADTEPVSIFKACEWILKTVSTDTKGE